ncbi:uncharacterized protein BYT42DRAFT_561138 [Radiomyces spectabilis]|uniref:uncharacterized protein n=1 Tax=Radiomyces spectabilis TaxID=64574 RepID=UPI0022206029|nr:uncharacterized protein BYT42DRAFT_561138 [Radiomyces spectabilis]KAI8388762.1 hypothetical protein BYT42DRAFT_561138 [Radiomyces spectabilis]
MPKRQNLKNKLKVYTVQKNESLRSSHDSDAQARTADNVDSVSTKLAKLRSEQARAAWNRQRQQRPIPSNMAEQSLNLGPSWLMPAISPSTVEASTSHRSAAGPPPPRSWITRKSNQIRTIHRKVSNPTEGVPSLCWLCSVAIARRLAEDYRLHADRYDKAFASLSIRVKQSLLRALATSTGINDRLLKLFQDEEYDDLCLESSSISFSKLLRTYWRVKPLQAKPPPELAVKEDWEDEEEEEVNQEQSWPEGEGYIFDPDDNKKEDTEMSYAMQQVLECAVPGIARGRPYLLSMPMASTLVSLNLSFIRPVLPSIDLAYLIVTTLPHLASLSTAACFTATEGPRALFILSHGLRRLEYWDIGYHEWMQLELLCGPDIGASINWKKDLLYLKVLGLQSSGRNDDLSLIGRRFSRWFNNEIASLRKYPLRILWP